MIAPFDLKQYQIAWTDIYYSPRPESQPRTGLGRCLLSRNDVSQIFLIFKNYRPKLNAQAIITEIGPVIRREKRIAGTPTSTVSGSASPRA